MEQLREIMGNLTGIEYDLESILRVLKALEENCEYECEYELALIVHLIKKVLDSISAELKHNITEIDKFLLDNKEK